MISIDQEGRGVPQKIADSILILASDDLSLYLPCCGRMKTQFLPLFFVK